LCRMEFLLGRHVFSGGPLTALSRMVPYEARRLGVTLVAK